MNVYGSVLGGGNGSIEYSTSEKAIGKWYDGSTLYQRTWTGTLNSSGETTTVNIGAIKPKSIEIMVSLDGTTVGKNITPVGQYHYLSSSDNAGSCVYTYENNLYIEYNGAGGSGYRGRGFVATIRYTK